jgi:hypothetical protein
VKEAQFLTGYDKAVKAVSRRHDLIGSTLFTLVLSCHQNGGVVSRHRRKQFAATVPLRAFDAVEAAVQRHLPRDGAAPQQAG